jgi:hypothetical protein
MRVAGLSPMIILQSRARLNIERSSRSRWLAEHGIPLLRGSLSLTWRFSVYVSAS